MEASEKAESTDDGTSVDLPQTNKSTTEESENNNKKDMKPATQPYTPAESTLDARQQSVDIDDEVELSESSSQITVVEASELNSQSATTDADVKSEALDESKTSNDFGDEIPDAEDATLASDGSSDEEGDEFGDEDIDEILGNEDTEEPVEYEAAVCMDDVRESQIKTLPGGVEDEWQTTDNLVPLENNPTAKQRVHFDDNVACDEQEIKQPTYFGGEEDQRIQNIDKDLEQGEKELDKYVDDFEEDEEDSDEEDDDDDEFDDDEFDDEEEEVYYDDRKFIIIEETRSSGTITYEAQLEETLSQSSQTQECVDNTYTDEDVSSTASSQKEHFENIRKTFETNKNSTDNKSGAEIMNANTKSMQISDSDNTRRKEVETRRLKERDEIISMLDSVIRTDDSSRTSWMQRSDGLESMQQYYEDDQRYIEEHGIYRYDDDDGAHEEHRMNDNEMDVSQGFIVLWHRSDGEEEDDEKPWLNSKPTRQATRPNSTMNSSKHVENLLYCSMCRNRMKQPKSLPCLHSFCRECLQQHVKKSDGRLICPQCRKDCPLSTDGVDGLLDSHFIHNLSEFVEQGGTAKDAVPNCDGCDKDASDRCLDCPCPLCPECSKMHKRMRGTKTHRIISLKEYNSLSDREKIMMQPTSCPYHPRCELEFFCTVCEVPICMKCAVCGHEDHKRMNLVDVYEKQAMEIDSLRNKLAERLKSFEEVAGRTRAVAETLEKEEKGVENQIVDHAERMHEAIDKRKEELIRELKMKSKSKKDILRRQVNNFGEVMHSLHDTYEKTGHLLTYGNRSDVVFAKKSALQRIIEQLEVPLKSQPEENSFIGFKSILNENVKLKLGNVLTTPAVAFQSRLERASGSYPLIGTEQVFFVRSVGHDGMEVKQGGAPVVAELSRPGTKGLALVDSVDTGDGNYRIAFQPDTPGRYRLDAKLFDESTRDSPMEFEVKSRWDVAMNYSQDMKQPHDVTKAWDDTYAIADYGNNRILIRDIAGKFYDQITFAGLEKPFCPISLATTPNNEIVCSDYNNHQIFVTRMDRSLRLRFGSNDLQRPLGVASFQTGKFAVGDGQTIKLFGNGGELLKTIGRRGQGDAEFSNPWFIATSPKNFMAVADEGNGRIQLLDAEGRFIRAFKVMPSGGQALNPRGVFMDDNDNIFVSATTSVLMYSNDGRLICRVNGEDSKMKSPCGITMLKAAMGSSPVLLVADRSDQCVKGFKI